jgi:tRNA (cytidine56-2'-O)-methyltransferase
VLRIGHRLVRDDRVTTHSALVSRAFGAEAIYMTGVDISVRQTLESVGKRWGGQFRVELINDWKAFARQWKNEGGRVVHLTMYGTALSSGISKLNCKSNAGRNVLVIIGAEKVPREAYDLADYNISVGNQPHSEIAALAVFLDRLFSGAELSKKFGGAALRIVPSPRGKKVREAPRKSIN